MINNSHPPTSVKIMQSLKEITIEVIYDLGEILNWVFWCLWNIEYFLSDKVGWIVELFFKTYSIGSSEKMCADMFTFCRCSILQCYFGGALCHLLSLRNQLCPGCRRQAKPRNEWHNCNLLHTHDLHIVLVTHADVYSWLLHAEHCECHTHLHTFRHLQKISLSL